jgi:hypothetical protein
MTLNYVKRTAGGPPTAMSTSRIQHLCDSCVEALKTAWRRYRLSVIAAFGLNLLAFGYLFFTYIYTNHVFPNIIDQGFPSFRTRLEGRWGGDLIYFLQGSRGIPLLDLSLAVPIQIANGVLFATLLGIVDPLGVFLAASLVSIHPFVSDYYSFAGDHLVLVLGDTAILAAFWLVQRRLRSLWSVPVAAVLIQFGISCYQPKISMAATIWLLILFARLCAWDGTNAMLRRDTREMSMHGASVLSGAALYVVLLRLSQWWLGDPAGGSSHSAVRLSTATAADFVPEARNVLRNTREILFASDFFGHASRMLVGVLLLLLIVLIGRRMLIRVPSARSKWLALTSFLLGLCLLPFALHAPYMVSPKSYLAGRMLIPIAYFTAFLPLALLMVERTRAIRWAVVAVSLFMCGRFVLIDAEAGHLARLRTTYEFEFVNRLASRIEEGLNLVPNERYALVVVGHPAMPAVLRPSVESRSNLTERSFIHFRDVEMLNFVLGRDLLFYPNKAQVQRGLEYAAQHSIWPAKDSVELLDDRILVVVLEPPHDQVATTMDVP